MTSVTNLSGRRDDPPDMIRFSETAHALKTAARLIDQHELPDCHVHVHNHGQCITFDYTWSRHAAGDVRVACSALGMTVEEYAADNPDGTAAIELRGTAYLDGILRTVRAVISLSATWNLP